MSDKLTITGVVGTEPRVFTTSSGVQVTSFRLATSQRYLDRVSGEWRDPGSNWFTVSCFRQLADHVAQSVRKGERVIVSGRLRLKPWASDSREGLNVDIEADSVGHDLAWGTSSFQRSVTTTAIENSGNDEFIPVDESEEWPQAAPTQVA